MALLAAPLLAVGLLLAGPKSARAQAITATIPLGTPPPPPPAVPGNPPLAINSATNKIYVGGVDGNVLVIDGGTHAITSVPLLQQAGQEGWQTGASAFGVDEASNTIYAALGGITVPAFPRDITYPGGLSILDGTTNATTTIQGGAFGLGNTSAFAVNPKTNTVYVTDSLSTGVTIIDGATNTMTGVSVPEGCAASAIAVNAINNKIYVVSCGTVIVIDGASHATTTVIGSQANVQPIAIAVNAVTNKIYVLNTGGLHGSVTVIDGATNATSNLETDAVLPAAIAVNSVTNKIYAANQGGNITVIDGATNAVSTITDPNALGPTAVVVNEATNKVFVANGGCCSPSAAQGSVTVIDGSTNSVTTLIDPKASGPAALVLDPVTDQIYVSNPASANLTVIDGAATPTTHTLAVAWPSNDADDRAITSNPAGINCGPASCPASAASFPLGTKVVLTAAADPKYVITWHGPCGGTTSCQVVMNSDQLITVTDQQLIAVPNVVGMTQSAATQAIQNALLNLGTITHASSTLAAGLVVSESPQAGTYLPQVSDVNIVISSGPPPSGGGSGSGGGGSMDWLALGALLGSLVAVRRNPTVARGNAIDPAGDE